MKTWLTLKEAAERIQGDAALASAERRIRRWVEASSFARYIAASALRR